MTALRSSAVEPRSSLRFLSVKVIAAAFLGLSARSASADPWPLGTFTPTSAVPNTCPDGFTCSGFEVTAPGVAETARGFLAVAPYTSATPRGLVTFFTGGSGGDWWTDEARALPAFANDLRAQGFSVAQVKWANSWLGSSSGNDAGTAHLGARPATVIRHVHDNYYLPLGITPGPVGQGGFVITGNSGGASQVSYALSHYGLEDILDVVIPTGGPPHSALAKSMLSNPGEEGYWYPLGTRRFIDRDFGYFGGNGPGVRQDRDFLPRWLEESVSTGGNDYYHPDTRIHFIIGERDSPMQAVASDYFDRLLDEGSPSVTWEIAPGTPHFVAGTPQGRAALMAAITTIVPEPSSALLILTGGPLFLLWRRRPTRPGREHARGGRVAGAKRRVACPPVLRPIA